MLLLDSLMLRRGPSKVRLGAARRLGESHDARAIPPLAEALEDGSCRVAAAAADSLAEIGGTRAASALVEHLHGDAPEEATPADEALIEIGGEATDPLLSLLSNSGSSSTLHALWLLGEIRDRRCTPPLLERLESGDSAVRIGVAAALGKIGDKRALEPLIMSLTDSDRKVCREVSAALRRVDSHWAESAAAGKCRRVLVERLEDAHKDVQREAANALLQIPGDAEPALLSFFSDALLGGDATAAYHLALTGAPGAVKPLVAALGDGSPSVRRTAASALGGLGRPEAIEALEELFDDGDDEEREIAIAGLVCSKEASPLELLIEALRDSAAKVRQCAAQTLGDRRDERAVRPLERALETWDLDELRVVAGALEKLGAPADLGDRLRRALTLRQWGEIVAMGRFAVTPLCEILDNSVDPLAVRVAAAELLGRIQDPRAFETLIDALTSDEEMIRRAAVVALMQMRIRWSEAPSTRPVVGELVRAVKSNLPPKQPFQFEKELSKVIRSVSVSILKEMGKGAIEPLASILRDGGEDLATRALAGAAIGWIGGSEAVEALAGELHADELLLRGVAAAALSNMGTTEAHLALMNTGAGFGDGGGDDYSGGGGEVDFDFEF